MTVSQTLPDVIQEITINAPATKVFDALTDPDQLPQWWGEDGIYHVRKMERDLKVGGTWRSTGDGADGKPFAVEGVYRVIDRPRVLEYTWNYDWAEKPAETIVRFDLSESGGKTRVRVTHSGFKDQAARDSHGEGWKTVLIWLSGFLQ